MRKTHNSCPSAKSTHWNKPPTMWFGPLQQGSPTPGPWTGMGPWPVWNRAAQQEVSGRQASEVSSAVPHRITAWTIPFPCPRHPSPTPVHGKIVFHETGPWCQKGWGPLIYKMQIPLNLAIPLQWFTQKDDNISEKVLKR